MFGFIILGSPHEGKLPVTTILKWKRIILRPLDLGDLQGLSWGYVWVPNLTKLGFGCRLRLLTGSQALQAVNCAACI